MPLVLTPRFVISEDVILIKVSRVWSYHEHICALCDIIYMYKIIIFDTSKEVSTAHIIYSAAQCLFASTIICSSEM